MPVPVVLNWDQVPEALGRFALGQCIGEGIRANVFEATDTELGNKKVAIKIQKLTKDNEVSIQQEFKIFQDYCEHPNLPIFYGSYKNVNSEGETDIWFVMELCEGGSVMDLIRKLHQKNRRMQEEHIAFILKETAKALLHLHQKHIIHRSICGDNILLTREGEVKLVDFGSAKELAGTLGKRSTCVGPACWLPPEVVSCSGGEEIGYGNRADVWALGITAIELGDGKPPLYGLHPTRIMFQVVRNPPPGLYRPGNWSEPYNDFVAECLEKNPEYRPFMEEVLEHPFLDNIPDNSYYLNQELKKINEDFSEDEKVPREPEAFIKNNLLVTSKVGKPTKMHVEDLAALQNVDEDLLISELKARFAQKHFYSFVGDVLLILNPNENRDLYNAEFHQRYFMKSRSMNPPHIYTIADRAYQDALHQEVPQHILVSGESGSGKTTAVKHLVEHLCYLGKSGEEILDSVAKSLNTIHAFTNASTVTNSDATRCIMKISISYGDTGRTGGGAFEVHQLEKWRVSSTDLSQSNFHILYYFYDAMESSRQLNKYLLEPGRIYRYLRIPEKVSNIQEIRHNPESNVKHFETILSDLQTLGISTEHIELMHKTLSTILNLGEICFTESEDDTAEIENPETCGKVAELLCIDEKKFSWALRNYCLMEQGNAMQRKTTPDQARDARDMLANCVYTRLVDWIVHLFNSKLAKNKAMYGEKYCVYIYDYFGFECFQRNDLEQLLINSFNEQMQYLYVNRVFAWEAMEQLEEDTIPPVLNYYNNKKGVDQLMGKPEGILTLIDEASKTGHGFHHILDSIDRGPKTAYIKVADYKKFDFSHYTGKIKYDIREMAKKNRVFLSPEIIDTLRLSSNEIIREFFVNRLTKSGNLICTELQDEKNRWCSGLLGGKKKIKSNIPDRQYSQTKHMRTAITSFRAVSLDILRELSVGAGSGGTHFIRCIRTDLTKTPNNFQPQLVKQQIRALSVLDTVHARQLGYPHRIAFPEFLRRYKFLAFDFDENVDISQDNCRLLLIRLKMEGWVIGKSKVFLKYYNEEYLSRLYETQVKKIIKIQSMMRAFLARRNMAKKLKKLQNRSGSKLIRQATGDLGAEVAAALLIQKAYRGYNVRKRYDPLIHKETGQLDNDTAKFIRPYAKKWKNKSIFQVILQYRSSRFQDLINLSQQIHIFNQNLVHELQKCSEEIDLEKVDPAAKADSWLGDKKPSVWKIPFNFDEIPYFDTEHMLGPNATADEEQEKWDNPLEWRRIINEVKTKDYGNSATITDTPNVQPSSSDQYLLNMPYTRDPSSPIEDLPKLNPVPIAIKSTKIESIKRTPQSYEPIKAKNIGRIQPPVNEIIISPRKFQPPSCSSSFEGANQDFEFIRSPIYDPSKLKKRSGNPIAELESLGRKTVEKANEDEPPFNFQGMLRKTNYKRESMKKIPESNEELSYTKVLKNKLNKYSAEMITFELSPGLIVEGIETEL